MKPETAPATDVVYPESDGKPMADNTLQWDWMVKIVGELRDLFAGQTVFIAGDLFWYPVEGDPKTVTAPDALVAFGRPPGYRGSYKQWEEGGIAPQVVFEVLSPSNTDDEMDRKREFYDRHGVEEYYLIDPYQNIVSGFRRHDGRLIQVMKMDGYVSPRLGIRFERNSGELTLYTPDGRPFQTREEVAEELRRTAAAFEDERARAIAESQRADRAEEQAARAEEQAARAGEQAAREQAAREVLAAKLREFGVNPDELLRPAG